MDGGAPSDREETGRGSDAPGEQADSRRRLVDAAVELILEHHGTDVPVREVFRYLTPAAVAARAGLSRGLIYHHWGSPEVVEDGSEAFTSFLTDVASEVWSAAPSGEELAAVVDGLPDDLDRIIEVTTSVAAYDGPAYERLRAGLAMSLYGVVTEEGNERTIAELGVMVRRLLDKVGMEPVPPLGVDDVVFALMAVYDGILVNAEVSRTRARAVYEWKPGAPPWRMVAILVEAILRQLCRPVDTGGCST